MDIYEYAMQMEKDGEQYYRELAQKTQKEGFRKILTMLADEEVKHFRIFQKMQNNEKAELGDTGFPDNVKNVFVKMREAKEKPSDEISQIEFYKKAQDIEKKSEDFYLEKADVADNPINAGILKKVAREEHRHFTILQNIIDFVSQPDQWLEDPEWYHVEEY